jgi:hypothetical protein
VYTYLVPRKGTKTCLCRCFVKFIIAVRQELGEIIFSNQIWQNIAEKTTTLINSREKAKETIFRFLSAVGPFGKFPRITSEIDWKGFWRLGGNDPIYFRDVLIKLNV